MAIKRKKTQKSKKIIPRENLGTIKENLEKTGEAVGDLFKGLFRGIGKILDVAQDMEKKGEKEISCRKEIKGFTKSGKEFRGETGWRVKTGILEGPAKPSKKKKKGTGKF